METKDYNVTITVKNNFLLSAMKESGFETAAQLSRACGVHQSAIGEYLNLKRAPYSTVGLSPSVEKISKCLKKLPEDLFPPQHLKNPLLKNKTEINLDSSSIREILYREIPSTQKLLEDMECGRMINDAVNHILDDREKRIVMARLGFDGDEQDDLESIGKREGLSRERVRQIEKKAMNKLKCAGRKRGRLHAIKDHVMFEQ